MLALLWKYREIAIGAAAGALMASGPVYLYGTYQGRQQAAAAAAVDASKAFQQRASTNGKVQTLDPVALCVELGGVRDDCAAELRGLGKDPGQAGNSSLPGRK